MLATTLVTVMPDHDDKIAASLAGNGSIRLQVGSATVVLTAEQASQVTDALAAVLRREDPQP